MKKDNITKDFKYTYYLDTSAINKLTDILSVDGAINTRRLAKKRNKTWILSFLNLYEIFNTSDEIRRETIICRMSQFYSTPGCIFSTPTRILFYDVLNYEAPETPFELSIYKTWFDITKNNKKTFVLDYNNFKKINKNIKAFSDVLKWITSNFEPEEPPKMSSDETMLSYCLYKQIKIFSPNEKLIKTESEYKLFHIKLLLILGIFCFGIEIESTFIDNYWNNKNINSTNDRFIYICTNFHTEVFDSKIINLMAQFLLFQSEQKKGIDRGAFRDSLHLTYCYKADLFLTSDKDIYKFSKENKFLNGRVVLVNIENLEFIKI